MKIKKDRKRKFIELCAQGIAPYRACIDAGYSEKYALRFAHILSEKYQNKIASLKPIAEAAAQELFEQEIKYKKTDCYNEFEEVRRLAMLPNEKGEYCNLNAANKAIENKGKLIGAFEADNQQKMPSMPVIQVADEITKNKIEQLINMNANNN